MIALATNDMIVHAMIAQAIVTQIDQLITIVLMALAHSVAKALAAKVMATPAVVVATATEVPATEAIMVVAIMVVESVEATVVIADNFPYA